MNINKFLKLTCVVLLVSAISAGDVSSSIFAGLKNQLKNSVSEVTSKAKTAVGNTKKQLTKSVSGLSDQATASLSAIKEAGANAISAINPKSKKKPEDVDEDLLLDDDLDIDDIDLESEDPAEKEKDSATETLLLEDISSEELSDSKNKNEDSEDLALDDDMNSDFSEDVITKVDSLFPDDEKLTSGKILNLNNKNLNDEDIAYIAAVKIPALSENIEKITLNLSNNRFTHEGLKVLLDSLKTMPKLVSILDCSGNKIGDEGAMAIADSLQQRPLNHTIILSNCGISGTGILGFLSSISEINNSTYQYLDLSKNNVDASYAPLIIEELQKLKENSFEDGINISETGIAPSEGTTLPGNVLFN